MTKQRLWGSFNILFSFTDHLLLSRHQFWLRRWGRLNLWQDRFVFNRVERACFHCSEGLLVRFHSGVLVWGSYFYRINTSWSFIKVKGLSETLEVNSLTRLTGVVRKRSRDRGISLMSWMNPLSGVIGLVRSCAEDSSIKVLLVDSSNGLLIDAEGRLLWNFNNNSLLNNFGFRTLI